MSEKVNFELALKNTMGLKGVRIDREKYLRTALKKRYPADMVEKAVKHSPAYAGITVEEINKIAKAAIKYEATKVTAISFAGGIPGGLAMAGTIPADIAQYFGHILRILQKLIYLYGWEDLFEEEEVMDDETCNLLTLFVGVMFGVNGATAGINRIAACAAQKVYKNLVNRALTKGMVYPIVKKVATALGLKMTKDIFAKGVSKAIPLMGAVTSAGLTFFTFKPMAKKLRKYLATLPQADVDFDADESNFDKVIDVEANEEFVCSIITELDNEIREDEKELEEMKKQYESVDISQEVE
ncbi:MAG: hypothetical protein IJN54_13620 [Lachnospiraceae bacterium]|nr:hypothetical protein [Lachnospiraceae bacterium]